MSIGWNFWVPCRSTTNLIVFAYRLKCSANAHISFFFWKVPSWIFFVKNEILILICKLFLFFRIIITVVKAWLLLCTAMTQVNRLDLGFELWHIIPCRYSIPRRDGMWNEGVLETVLWSLGPFELNRYFVRLPGSVSNDGPVLSCALC